MFYLRSFPERHCKITFFRHNTKIAFALDILRDFEVLFAQKQYL